LLRVSRSASELPVIMVTAMSETKDIVEALALGANDYITKPVDMAAALARIDTQLRRKRAEEELADSRERLALVLRDDGRRDRRGKRPSCGDYFPYSAAGGND